MIKTLYAMFAPVDALGYNEAHRMNNILIAESRHDWREVALKEAARKYGRAFKCSGSNMDREVLVGKSWIVTRAGEEPKSQKNLVSIVTPESSGGMTVLRRSRQALR